MSNFAIVTEIFMNEAGESAVSPMVYTDIDAGKSAFYDKARYIPIFQDKGYKAVTIMDMFGNNILNPVIKINE